jgi:hypothetical protein
LKEEKIRKKQEARTEKNNKTNVIVFIEWPEKAFFFPEKKH